MTTQIRMLGTHHRYSTWEAARLPCSPVSVSFANTARMAPVTPVVVLFIRCCILLLSMVLWPGSVGAGSPDWGSGFYRLNPAQEPAFTSDRNRETDFQPSDRDGRFPVRPPQTPETRRTPPPREWPTYRENRGDRSRYDRPWGEVPPELRNEDLNYRIPEGYERARPPARYYDAPEERPWSPPEERMRDERNTWEYPYPPERSHRRRDSRSDPYYEDRYSDRYPDDRSGDWGYRRRTLPYYYDGGDGWWDAP